MDEAMNVFLRKRKILQAETWVMRAILAEAFLIALWPAGATAALAIGIVFWMRRLQVDPEFHFRHLPFDVPISLFVIISAVSVLASPDRAFSFYNYYNLVGVYALTYLLIGQNIRSRFEVKKLIGALAVSALLVVLYGFYQYLFGIDTGEMRWVDGEAFPELRTRVFSTWENPNILAGYLDAAICVALGIFAKTSGRPRKLFLACSMALMALCLAMTYARGACFAMLLIFVIYGVLRDKRILIACLAGGVFLLLADPTLYERMISVFTKVDTSSEMRWAIWESTIAMIEDHPFFGIGWGAFWMVYPSYDFYLQGADVKLVHAHNVYLNYAAEIGIAGALAFFWYFFGTLRLAFGFRDEKLEEERQAAREQEEKKRQLSKRVDELTKLLAVRQEKEAERRRKEEEQERKRAAEEQERKRKEEELERKRAEEEERARKAEEEKEAEGKTEEAALPEEADETPSAEEHEEVAQDEESGAEDTNPEESEEKEAQEEEPAEEIEAQSEETPAEETAEEPEEASAEAPAEETAEEPEETAAEAPAEEPAEEPEEASAEVSVEEPAEELEETPETSAETEGILEILAETEKLPETSPEAEKEPDLPNAAEKMPTESLVKGVVAEKRSERKKEKQAERKRREKEQAEKARQKELEKRWAKETAALEDQLREVKQSLAEMEEKEEKPLPLRPVNYEKELRTWEPHVLCEGISFGIGIAFVSVALNGLTDDLLFNIPTSMLLWLLAALAAAIPEMPKEETEKKSLFYESMEDSHIM